MACALTSGSVAMVVADQADSRRRLHVPPAAAGHGGYRCRRSGVPPHTYFGRSNQVMHQKVNAMPLQHNSATVALVTGSRSHEPEFPSDSSPFLPRSKMCICDHCPMVICADGRVLHKDILAGGASVLPVRVQSDGRHRRGLAGPPVARHGGDPPPSCCLSPSPS